MSTHATARRALLPGLLALLLALVAGTSLSHGQPVLLDHAGLVVQFGDGTVQTACVPLPTRGWTTAAELLDGAPLDVDTATAAGTGTAVCQIGAQGCNTDAAEGPTEPCFCQCTDGSTCERWHYHELDGATWRASLALESVIEAGDVVGWAWGNAITARLRAAPPFTEICAARAAPAATIPPEPTNTPAAPAEPPEPTNTLVPTNTPAPTVPPAPSLAPVPTATPTPVPTASRPTQAAQLAPTTAPPTALPTLLPTGAPLPARTTPPEAPTRWLPGSTWAVGLLAAFVITLLLLLLLLRRNLRDDPDD